MEGNKVTRIVALMPITLADRTAQTGEIVSVDAGVAETLVSLGRAEYAPLAQPKKEG